ncbi:hypothetical protein ET495_09975 [Xylanimonas allomyrinae]|uniref:Uncharacterized protein n=1 Tax=Xylanimonas allomyrinae TaxID=2509459 RepID=A0A4P6EL87_9MICO|nr:hypothetical protein [Xylanimonas allomyrinae]QAY63520.1 hypothetical protein ET495_09975 [Xylanimonas allomyrinae]
MEPDRRRTLAIAGQALAALEVDPAISDNARYRYARALSKLWALTGAPLGSSTPGGSASAAGVSCTWRHVSASGS